MMEYTTEHGSKVIVNDGKATVNLDWLEEPNACIECEPNPYPQDGYLTWECEYCGGGEAILKTANPE